MKLEKVNPDSTLPEDLRTRIAIRMMQGIVSHYGASTPESNAKLAVDNAEALIRELNKR